MKYGLYSVQLRILAGVKGPPTGMIIFRDGVTPGRAAEASVFARHCAGYRIFDGVPARAAVHRSSSCKRICTALTRREIDRLIQ
jgi:hypothetical protein